MSLHGSIEVNNQRVGYWQAQRVVTGEPNVYNCEVNRVTGSPATHHFQIEHRYEDGAIVLAAKVLAYAADDQLACDQIRATKPAVRTPEADGDGEGLV